MELEHTTQESGSFRRELACRGVFPERHRFDAMRNVVLSVDRVLASQNGNREFQRLADRAITETPAILCGSGLQNRGKYGLTSVWIYSYRPRSVPSAVARRTASHSPPGRRRPVQRSQWIPAEAEASAWFARAAWLLLLRWQLPPNNQRLYSGSPPLLKLRKFPPHFRLRVYEARCPRSLL